MSSPSSSLAASSGISSSSGVTHPWRGGQGGSLAYWFVRGGRRLADALVPFPHRHSKILSRNRAPLPVWGDACYVHVKNWRYQTTVLQVLASYRSDDNCAENSVGFTLCSRLLA